MRARFPIKLADIVIISLSLLAVGASVLLAASGPAGSARVLVESPKGEFVYPLDEDAEIAIEGQLGTTVLRIEDGAARIAQSPCDNKLCVDMGPLREKGQWASCLPNRVLVRIAGGKGKEEADAVSY